MVLNVCEKFIGDVVEQLRVIPNWWTDYFTILLLSSCASKKHFSAADRYYR